MELNNKVAVITGAAGGIGLGIARACLAEGMRVMISDVDEARLAETAEALKADGGEVIHEACDVRAFNEVEALRDSALAGFGQIDLVCNNAGVGLTRPFWECTEADWNLLIDVNLRGVANGLRTFVPVMIEQGTGHLSATSSLSGLMADPGLAVYNATKFAVTGMMEALALELMAEHPGITASVLCPGPVATDLMNTSEKHLAEAGSGATSDPGIADYLAAGLHPDEVGRIAVDGIRNGLFWLLTHPEYTVENLDARHAAMKKSKLWVPPTDWMDQR